jgi:hypothetical protein
MPVEMVGHEAESENAHRDALGGGRQEAEEGRVIVLLVEDFSAGIATVEDVITHSSDGSSSGTRHAKSLAAGRPRRQEK